MAKRTAAHKARTVAKGHAHVKAAAAHHKAATGHAQKHHKAAKHHAAAKKHKGTVHRGLAIGDSVACCAAEALAVSLRLSGVPVSDADVLDLYWRTADDEDAGAPILATLEAASEFGLAAVRPASIGSREVDPALCSSQLGCPGQYQSQPMNHVTQTGGSGHAGDTGMEQHVMRPMLPAALILGIDLPGPHAVLATPDGWWSWGELWCPCEFPDAVIEEAWEVTWR